MPESVPSVTIDDFITGLLASLARQNRTVIALRPDSFYRAIEGSFVELEKWADAHGVEVRFWFEVDPVHADAPDVRDAITRAVRDDLVSLDNPIYQHMRIKIDRDYAERYLSRLAGGAELYDALASVFLEEYAGSQELELA